MTLEDDYTRFLMAAGDDDTLIRVVSDSSISKLKPVLKANGVKGICKMKKADIAEAVIELVRMRKTRQQPPSKIEIVSCVLSKANTVSEIRQILDKNFTIKELRESGWACFKERNLPKSYVLDRNAACCIHMIADKFIKLLQDIEPRVDIDKLYRWHSGHDAPNELNELNEQMAGTLNVLLDSLSYPTGIVPDWNIKDTVAVYHYLRNSAKDRTPYAEKLDDEFAFMDEFSRLADRGLSLQQHYIDSVTDKAQLLLDKVKSFGRKEDILSAYHILIIEALYAKHTNQIPTTCTSRSEMIHGIMVSLEFDDPDIADFNFRERILEAKSKAERMAILDRCTHSGLADFAEWEHESLYPAPYISFNREYRRSIVEKCMSRFKDDI